MAHAVIGSGIKMLLLDFPSIKATAQSWPSQPRTMASWSLADLSPGFRQENNLKFSPKKFLAPRI